LERGLSYKAVRDPKPSEHTAALFRGLQGTYVTPTRDDVYVAQPRTIGVTVSKSL